MNNETKYVRAARIAAKRVADALDLAKAQILEAKAQQGNLRQVIGKAYKDLTPDEIMRLAAIYHSDDEPFPCEFCRYIAAEEYKKLREGE